MIERITGMLGAAFRFYVNCVGIFLAVVIAVTVVLWLVGSSHVGHFLNMDELEAFEREAGRWLASGWR